MLVIPASRAVLRLIRAPNFCVSSARRFWWRWSKTGPSTRWNCTGHSRGLVLPVNCRTIPSGGSHRWNASCAVAGRRAIPGGRVGSQREGFSVPGSFGFQSAGGQDGILPRGMGFQGRCCRAGVRSWGCTVVWGGVRDPVCLGYQLGRSTSSWVLPSAPLPGGMGVLYLMVADPRPTWISSTAVSMMALVI